MKKINSFLFASLLFFALTVFATLMGRGIEANAASELDVTSDKTLTNKFNVYDNVIVEKNVTLTLADRAGEPVGLEIAKSLKVKKGGKIQGNGILIFNRDATIEGIDLYYLYQGEYHKIPEGQPFLRLSLDDPDYRPNFVYNKKKGFYVIDAEYKGGDPFEVELNMRETVLIRGKKTTLSLSGITKGIKWTSSDKSVATVSAKGVVKGKKLGRVTITATYDGREYACEVEVVKKGLSSSTLNMFTDTEFFLNLYGTEVKSVRTSNKRVAKINKQLKVTAVGNGECKITITGKNGKKYICTVSVGIPDAGLQPVPDDKF